MTTERCRTLLAAVGGGGCRVLDLLGTGAAESVRGVALHTDAAALAQLGVPRRLLMGEETCGGLSTGGDPDAGRQAAEASADAIRALFADADLVFLLAALGGGTGSGAAPVVARLAREAGALVLGVATLPFFFEGQQRRRCAEEGLQRLREQCGAVIVFPNQRMLDTFQAGDPVHAAFDRVDRAVGEGLQALARVLAADGIVRLDFSDLRAMVAGADGTLALATAEAHGAGRAEQVVEQIMASPLLEHGNVMASARSLLTAVAGGPDMTLAELQAIMTGLGARARPDVRLHFGTAVLPELGDRVTVTVLATEADRPAPVPAPEVSASPPEPASAGAGGAPSTRASRKPAQGMLRLDGAGKGRFRDVEPTLYEGEDLDVPTFIRRGLRLNRP